MSVIEGSLQKLVHGQFIMWYLYITSNRNGRFYTGITTNLERRFEEHQQGRGGRYTSRNRPLKVVYAETFANRVQAERREQQIKCWSKKKKEALIESNFDKLRKLSISRDHLVLS